MPDESVADELPFSSVTRATTIGVLCGVILVGLYAMHFERIASGSWWLVPLPGIVAGCLGAVLNRFSLPVGESPTTVKRSHRRLVTGAVTPLVVMAGVGVILAGLALANFESFAGDLWASGGGSSILIVDVLGFVLLMLALVVVLIALIVVLAVIGVAGAVTTAAAYIVVWRALDRGRIGTDDPTTGAPPD